MSVNPPERVRSESGDGLTRHLVDRHTIDCSRALGYERQVLNGGLIGAYGHRHQTIVDNRWQYPSSSVAPGFSAATPYGAGALLGDSVNGPDA